MLNKIWNMWIRFLKFIRATDENGDLSITNISFVFFAILIGEKIKTVDLTQASITDIAGVAATIVPLGASMLLYDRKKARAVAPNEDLVNEGGYK
jgi:hypothetical protein